MKKFLLTLMIVVAAMTARATDFPYLVFQTTDGTTYTMAVESLTLNISDGQLIAANNETTHTFALTSLSKMYFSETTVGVDENTIAENEEVEVYAVTGVLLGRYTNVRTAVQSLKGGVYVLKTQSGTQKIAVK